MRLWGISGFRVHLEVVLGRVTTRASAGRSTYSAKHTPLEEAWGRPGIAVRVKSGPRELSC